MNRFINITLQLNDENSIFDTQNVVEESKVKIDYRCFSMQNWPRIPVLSSLRLCKGRA